jgi:hypothetical protein
MSLPEEVRVMRLSQAIHLLNVEKFPSESEIRFHYSHLSLTDRERIKQARAKKGAKDGD